MAYQEYDSVISKAKVMAHLLAKEDELTHLFRALAYPSAIKEKIKHVRTLMGNYGFTNKLRIYMRMPSIEQDHLSSLMWGVLNSLPEETRKTIHDVREILDGKVKTNESNIVDLKHFKIKKEKENVN